MFGFILQCEILWLLLGIGFYTCFLSGCKAVNSCPPTCTLLHLKRAQYMPGEKRLQDVIV